MERRRDRQEKKGKSKKNTFHVGKKKAAIGVIYKLLLLLMDEYIVNRTTVNNMRTFLDCCCKGSLFTFPAKLTSN